MLFQLRSSAFIELILSIYDHFLCPTLPFVGLPLHGLLNKFGKKRKKKPLNFSVYNCSSFRFAIQILGDCISIIASSCYGLLCFHVCAALGLKADPSLVCTPQTCLLPFPRIDLSLCRSLDSRRDIGMKKMSSMLTATYKRLLHCE